MPQKQGLRLIEIKVYWSGQSPIFHPKFESLAFARLFSLYMAVGTCSHKAIYNEKVVVRTLSNFGDAPAASRWERR